LVLLLPGPAYADCQTGEAAVSRKDYVTALKEFSVLAEQGDPCAQTNLAHMHLTGSGTTQDYGEALRWYRLAADQGYAEAQYNLGVMHDQGEGVTKDSREAVK
jgi:TPR repeat protein